jgi:hypothetical protein
MQGGGGRVQGGKQGPGGRLSGVGEGKTVRSNLVWSSRLEGNDRDKGKE